MAFVLTPNSTIGVTAFRGDHVSHKSNQRPRTRTARVRMAVKEDSDSLWTSVGKTKFKENVFTGGMPGGEAFYRAWIEDGMEKDVPDVPSGFQPKAAFKPKEEVKTGILADLDKTEFFEGFNMPAESDEEKPASGEEKEGETVPEQAADDSGPNPALYEKYFPDSVRNKAPEIKIVYENDYLKDRVSVAMTEVTASFSDVYYPKEMKNKAPVIDISYNGNLATASVSVSMEHIEGLPTLPPPPKAEGDTITSLVPGAGGGLKLQFDVAGAGPANV
ncbi:hypothetical protein BWQ96_00880 [Gracilariopsis chorda]|uniref:Uncharacterized protein n=1 Tax=Gracilariopsis chorda TaxID=448386 RepID=A0A2V3J4C6_9FLOR|nr:hypothetical protein BWQ96_00880 [Gracilariopsis chorda]|eukprot:PXF49306.1 hypothetical protein BWQ96_00880 [Gracilariopsis chorda]